MPPLSDLYSLWLTFLFWILNTSLINHKEYTTTGYFLPYPSILGCHLKEAIYYPLFHLSFPDLKMMVQAQEWMLSALTALIPLAWNWTERWCIRSSAGWPMMSAGWVLILWTRTVSILLVSSGYLQLALVKSLYSPLSYLHISIPLHCHAFFHFLCRLHTSNSGYHHQEWVFSVFINLYHTYDSHVFGRKEIKGPIFFPQTVVRDFP